MPKHPSWNILVQKQTEIVAEFSVPAHKLPKHALHSFLHGLVVRYSTRTAQEMLPYYVSNTRGLPKYCNLAEVHYFCEPDKPMNGYFCGTWECLAKAWQIMKAEEAEGVMLQLEMNRQARNVSD